MKGERIVQRPLGITLFALLLLLAVAVCRAQSPPPSASRLFQEAFLLEQGRGDLVGAVQLYERLVRIYPNENALAARALMRLGTCYELLGEEAAAQAYQIILDRYSDQSEIALEARRKLDRLRGRRAAPDPPDPGFSLREFTVSGTPVFDGQASLSPDGKHLAHVSIRSPYPLVVADLSSGEKSRVHEPRPVGEGIANRYRWSHDSRRLAFDVVTASGGTLWVYDFELGRSEPWVKWKDQSHVLLDWGAEDESVVCLVRDPEDLWDIVVYGPHGEPLGRVRSGGANCGDLRIQPRHGLAACTSAGQPPDIVIFPLDAPSESRTIAPHPGIDRSPIWSPDGRHLAFLSDRDETGTFDLWAVRVGDDGRAGAPFVLVRDLGEGVRLQNWSRDGRMTFHKENRLRDVWALPMSSGSAEVVGDAFVATTRQGRNFQPAVSPSGRRIAFLSSDPDNHWRLGLVDLESADETFAELDADSVFNPTWRDESTVVLSAWDDSGGYFLEFDAGRGSQAKVMDGREYAGLTSSEGWRRFPPNPDASPDGTRLLFSAAGNSWQSSSLYQFDGSSLVQLPGSAGLAKPRWSPDGRRIAFLDTRANTLEVSNPDLTRRQTLVQLPEGESFGTFCWSPDGRFIVYPRFREEAILEGEYWRLWVVSTDGRQHRPLTAPRGLNPWWVDWAAEGSLLIMGSLRGLPSFFGLENFWPQTQPR